MSMTCKHGRKSWKCKYCHNEQRAIEESAKPNEVRFETYEAADPSAAVQKFLDDAAKIGIKAGCAEIQFKHEMMNTPPDRCGDPAHCPVPIEMIPPKYQRMQLVDWQEYDKRGVRAYRMKFLNHMDKQYIWTVHKSNVDRHVNPCRRKTNIKVCPVPRAMYCAEVREGNFELESWTRLGHMPAYKLNFNRLSDDQRYTQVVMVQEVEDFKGGGSPHEEVRDSEFLLRMMSEALDRKVGLTEGSEIVDHWLRQFPGYPKLDGAPRVDRGRAQLTFPTTNGLKHVSERMFYEWLRRHDLHLQPRLSTFGNPGHGKTSVAHNSVTPFPGIDYAEMEMRVAAHLGIAIDGAKAGEVVKVMYGQITGKVEFNEIRVAKGAVLQIEEACTLHVGDRKLRVVNEGGKLTLIDERFKPLC
jgi:hypothetical protein